MRREAPRLTDWRLAALGGATVGLALAPHVAGNGAPLALAAVPLACALAAARPRPSGGERGTRPAPAIAWLALVVATATVAGLGVGGERVQAIDAGALDAKAGSMVSATGFVTAVPRRSRGTVSIRVQTAEGRLLIEAPEPVPELPVGREVTAAGAIRDPGPWEAGYLRVHGIRDVLSADRIRPTSGRRGGIAGLADRVRDRAERALERGMPPEQGALARGFVLGQDDRIDPATIDDFKRSGLAHLLAVSGQNVLLLALLAVPLLAALGVPLRARLVCILALIALYVPVAGAGPSIQRAGVMGAAGVVALLAGRARSRWYALGLAALVTLALNPRASADVGWQLSFAAVGGILLWAAPLRDLLLGHAAERSSAATALRRALAEGAGLTVAATLATAPLMAHHFEAFSLAALPANLLSLPAIAPVMWLGMLAAMAGQVPAIPVEPVNHVNALLIAYVAQIAHWLGSPEWAQAQVRLSAGGVVAVYAALLASGRAISAWARRRRGFGARVLFGVPGGGAGVAPPGRGRRAFRVVTALAASGLLVLAIVAPPSADPPAPKHGLEVSVLDVGQGDAILLEPVGAEPVLIDAGPPGEVIGEELRDEGVERLGLLAITHDQLDHAGGVPELAASVPIETFGYARASPSLLATAERAGARTIELAGGETIHAGPLRLDVLWPPRELLDADSDGPEEASESSHPSTEEANRLSLVLRARWRRFSLLLTGDAEAEAAPLEPGHVDVLKVAHHGSEDAGLAELVDRAMPSLAVISVGEDNPFGHPAPATLAELEERGIPTMRTDLHGEIEIEVEEQDWSAHPD